MTTTYLAYIPSPSQGVWHLGPIPLRAYAFFIIIGIIAALALGDRRWVARGGQQGVIYDVALLAVPFGLIGGRLYHVMTDWRTYFGDDGAGLAGALRIWDGGLGIWGAVALGGVGAWIACRFWKGIPLPAFGDAIAPGIILAQAIGRLGNYFNQELYGRPTTLPWGLIIYERRDASGALDTLNGVSTGQQLEVVHPTFLYELLWNLLIFAALIYLDRRFKMGHGRLFATYVAGYCLGRFWVELMRSDVATHFAGIRVNSFTSTFVFIGAVVYIMVAPKGREDPAELVGKPEAADEAFAKELTAVAATTGVVAAAKAAGDVEDEDAKAAVADVEDAKPDEPDAPDEAEVTDKPAVPDAEALGADVAGVPADTIEEAEEFAAEGEDEPESADEADEPEVGLGAVEADEVAEAVDAAPEVHEAEAEPADGPEADEAAESEAGLGAVEADEVAEAVDAAPEVHEAEVEAANQAEAVADELADEAETADAEAGPADGAETDEAAESEAGLGAVEADEVAEAVDAAPEVRGAEVEAADEAEAEPADGAEADEGAAPEAGLGAVEADEVAEAVDAAPEVHEAEAEAADGAEAVADDVADDGDAPLSEATAEAEELADEVAEAPDADIEAAAQFAAAGAQADAVEADESEADEPETEAAEAAVKDAAAEASEDKTEAVDAEADAAVDAEPKTGVLSQATSTPADEPEPAGRLSRWLRRSR